MKRHFFTVGIAVVALFIGTVGRATDTGSITLQVHCKGSGTFADGVETNGFVRTCPTRKIGSNSSLTGCPHTLITGESTSRTHWSQDRFTARAP